MAPGTRLALLENIWLAESMAVLGLAAAALLCHGMAVAAVTTLPAEVVV